MNLFEEWYRIYGFDLQHGLSSWKDWVQRMHPEDRAKVEQTKDRAISAKSDYEVDHRILLHRLQDPHKYVPSRLSRSIPSKIRSPKICG